ncbi:S8 family peptidase [Lysinibacillus sp. UGB7]|uniref:S8 family peptidase n=1 Tax=Lysinibacillus sp. UGB7 TaxID=3411039 RepID=UPI003B7C5FE5
MRFKKYVFLAICIISAAFLYEHKKNISIEDLYENQAYPDGIEYFRVEEVWDKGYFGEKIKIAILDTGIDFGHPDFEGQINTGFNAIDNNSLPIDDSGHGTNVTGIIAAKNNDIGVVGISPSAEIYPIKVLDEFGEGEIEDIIQGIEWCIDNEIDIINMSFSTIKNDQKFFNVINKAINAGIFIVAAIDNNRERGLGYPALYEGVIAVASLEWKNLLSAEEVDFFAPGNNIFTTAIGGKYIVSEGNSIATPHITGLIALIIDQYQTRNYKDVICLLKKLVK